MTDAAGECSNARLCDNCSKALQKPLVCAKCKTATYCSKDCQVKEEELQLIPGYCNRLVKGTHKHGCD